MTGGLPVEALEAVWERLAEAIDQAGPGRRELFLAKLALLLGNELGDRDTVERLIAAALADLD